MDDAKLLDILLSYSDETVGVFEPTKVLKRVGKAFSGAEIDWTDQHRERLLRELDWWSERIPEPERRERFLANSWGTYQANGPSYLFVVPLPSGLRVNGGVSRLHLWFRVPADIPSGDQERLVSFLRSIRMGDLSLYSGGAAVVDEVAGGTEHVEGGTQDQGTTEGVP